MNEDRWSSFIELWDKQKYSEAVNLRYFDYIYGGTNVLNQLFRDASNTIPSVGISFIDIIYDYLMVNPAVIKTIDFSKKENLSNFFTFQQDTETIDFDNYDEITRLEGNTSEQMIALELQGKGHEVIFQEKSNQSGYNLLVDGYPFQVKCTKNPSDVYEHLRNYPYIPVLVNQELIQTFENNPLVYGTEVSIHTVKAIVNKTIQHAEELSNFDIPLINIALASLVNGYKILFDGLDIRMAGLNVVNNVVVKGIGGFAGKTAGLIMGPVFGPAGVVVLPMFFGWAGAYNGKKLTNYTKRIYSFKKRENLKNDIILLIDKVLNYLPEKISIREQCFNYSKQQIMNDPVLTNIIFPLKDKYNEKQRYTANKAMELEEWRSHVISKKFNIEKDVKHILDTVLRSQVHPIIFQKELHNVGLSYKEILKL